jgi:hypothetical protein
MNCRFIEYGNPNYNQNIMITVQPLDKGPRRYSPLTLSPSAKWILENNYHDSNNMIDPNLIVKYKIPQKPPRNLTWGINWTQYDPSRECWKILAKKAVFLDAQVLTTVYKMQLQCCLHHSNRTSCLNFRSNFLLRAMIIRPNVTAPPTILIINLLYLIPYYSRQGEKVQNQLDFFGMPLTNEPNR